MLIILQNWAENVPIWKSEDFKATVRVWAGQPFTGITPLPVPLGSYASDPEACIGIWHIKLQPGGVVNLDPAPAADVCRVAYVYRGDSLTFSTPQESTTNVTVERMTAATLRPESTTSLRNDGNSVVEILVLQGRPLGEPVVVNGTMVTSTEKESEQAFADYVSTTPSKLLSEHKY